MKKIVTTLIVLLVGVNVYAVDVSEFDIKGIKLGMSKSEVLKRMPCVNPRDSSYDTYGSWLLCELGERNFSNSFNVVFDHQDKILYIAFGRSFEVAPDFNGIVYKRITTKYGSPVKTQRYKSYSNNVKSYCWGKCEIWDRQYTRFESSNPYLEITYTDRDNSKSDMYDDIDFTISNSKRLKKFRQYIKQKEYAKKVNKKSRESNFDF